MSAQLYYIALVPPEPLRSRVKSLKEEILERFGAGHALKSPAHITLRMPFRMSPEMENRVIHVLRAVAGQNYQFRVELDGFDCFSPRVLFLNVKDHNPIRALRAELLRILEKTGIRGLEHPAMNFHPHMTLATRDLTEAAFSKAWPEFASREFYGAFTASSLWLLKHNGQYWELYREFGFAVQ